MSPRTTPKKYLVMCLGTEFIKENTNYLKYIKSVFSIFLYFRRFFIFFVKVCFDSGEFPPKIQIFARFESKLRSFQLEYQSYFLFKNLRSFIWQFLRIFGDLQFLKQKAEKETANF